MHLWSCAILRSYWKLSIFYKYSFWDEQRAPHNHNLVRVNTWNAIIAKVLHWTRFTLPSMTKRPGINIDCMRKQKPEIFLQRSEHTAPFTLDHASNGFQLSAAFKSNPDLNQKLLSTKDSNTALKAVDRCFKFIWGHIGALRTKALVNSLKDRCTSLSYASTMQLVLFVNKLALLDVSLVRLPFSTAPGLYLDKAKISPQ